MVGETLIRFILFSKAWGKQASPFGFEIKGTLSILPFGLVRIRMHRNGRKRDLGCNMPSREASLCNWGCARKLPPCTRITRCLPYGSFFPYDWREGRQLLDYGWTLQHRLHYSALSNDCRMWSSLGKMGTSMLGGGSEYSLPIFPLRRCMPGTGMGCEESKMAHHIS